MNADFLYKKIGPSYHQDLSVSRNPKKMKGTDGLFSVNLLDLRATEKLRKAFLNFKEAKSRGMKFLIVVTGVGTYQNKKLKTGLWLSELTHMYHSAKEQGYEITIASPEGGNTPIDPESLRPMMLDKLTKSYYADESFMNELKDTKSLKEVENQEFDVVYLTGGHGTMYDFPDNTALQNIIRTHYENNKIISAICHGVGGLLNVKLSDGEYLIKSKTITGFNWFEERLARRRKEVPFNLEAELKKRKVNYQKALIPMTSKVHADGNLITGQNPFSSKEIAKAVMDKVKKK